MKKIWYFLKFALIVLGYMLCMDILTIFITYIPSNIVRLVLIAVCLGLYCTAIYIIMFKEGESALDLRYSNDVRRRHMIETGEVEDIFTTGEYKPYKGFLMGLLSCALLIILLIIHLILGLSSGAELKGAGQGAAICYFVFYLPIIIFTHPEITATNPILWGEYFYLLYVIIFNCLAIGVPYIVGAKKSQEKYDKIEEKKRAIYGDKE